MASGGSGEWRGDEAQRALLGMHNAPFKLNLKCYPPAAYRYCIVLRTRVWNVAWEFE